MAKAVKVVEAVEPVSGPNAQLKEILDAGNYTLTQPLTAHRAAACLAFGEDVVYPAEVIVTKAPGFQSCAFINASDEVWIALAEADFLNLEVWIHELAHWIIMAHVDPAIQDAAPVALHERAAEWALARYRANTKRIPGSYNFDIAVACLENVLRQAEPTRNDTTH